MLFPNRTFLKPTKTAHSCHNKEKLIDLNDKKRGKAIFDPASLFGNEITVLYYFFTFLFLKPYEVLQEN